MIKLIKFSLSMLGYLRIADSWKLLKPCDILLLAHNNDRAYAVEGKSYSQLIHTLRYYFENKGFICEGISTAFDSNNYTHNYYQDKTINRFFLWNFFKAKFRALFLKHNYQETKINGETILWYKILAKTKPKLVIGIQPYDSLCMVCHQLKIPIYDFQHGAITETSLSYGREYNFTKDLARLPTGYLCWDEDSAAVLAQWCPQRNIQILVLGHPWLHRFNSNDSNDVLLQQLHKNTPLSSPKKTILITLQWGLGTYYPDFYNPDDAIHSVVIDVIKQLSTEVKWLIRLHPVQIKDKNLVNSLKKLFKNNLEVDIDWASKEPLPLVLSVSHGHITWDSNVVAEAAHFNIKSYVINPGHFSTNLQNPNTSQLPFFQQEMTGLVTRSLELPNKKDIIDWIHALPLDKPRLNLGGSVFDLEKLYALPLLTDISLT